MPPDMEISMRHTKLKAQEAALLAGEISKPSWESKNEGIHERVSFEDTIWGFDLAGGIYYKTPLRVTYVKPESRAEKAGIRPGDKLLRINDIDTSTLTIQEAHDLIVESGIYLKLAVTSPDDEEDAFYYYEDPLVESYDSEEEMRLEEEKAKKRRVHAKVSHFWSLQWPWVSKKRLIYRESNCFMVNSKYEEARRDKYPPLPTLRYTDDVFLYHKDGEDVGNYREDKTPTLRELKERTRKSRQQRMANCDIDSDVTLTDDEQLSHLSEDDRSVNRDTSIPPAIEELEQEEAMEDQEMSQPTIQEYVEETEGDETIDENVNEEESNILSPIPEGAEDKTIPEDTEQDKVPKAENHLSEVTEGIPVTEEINGETEVNEQAPNEDDVLNEVLGKSDSMHRNEEDNNILDSILSDDGQNLESSEDNNER